MKESKVFLLVGLTFFTFSIVLLYNQTYKTLLSFYKSKSFIQVNGELLKAELVSNHPSTRVSVEYKYTYENKNYESTSVSINNIFTNTGVSEKLLATILKNKKKNSSIPVYINPHNPQTSFLNISLSLINFIPFTVMGVLLLIIGLFSLHKSYKLSYK